MLCCGDVKLDWRLEMCNWRRIRLTGLLNEWLTDWVNEWMTSSTKPSSFIFSTFFHILHILSYSLGSILYHCVCGCVFCMLLFNFVNYIFLLLRLCILTVIFMFCYCYVYVFLLLCYMFLLLCLCILIVMYVPFCVSFVCKCVLYYC
jgi:hypothetical protein